jgi:hypothetical protein
MFPLVVVLVSAGCGAPANSTAPKIERTFHVNWHDTASGIAATYATSRVAFHDGRWSADITVTNQSDKPLYEATWAPIPGSFRSWNGPALVYSGLDVLQQRALIYLPADTEQPDIPFPLKPGASWRGTIGGKVPADPPVPKADPIWVRYPVFGVGAIWDNFTTASAVVWISLKSVQL